MDPYEFYGADEIASVDLSMQTMREIIYNVI